MNIKYIISGYKKASRATLIMLLTSLVFVSFMNSTTAEPLVIQKGLVPESPQAGETVKAYVLIQPENDETVQASTGMDEKVWAITDKTDGKTLEYSNLDAHGKLISFRASRGHTVDVSVFGILGPTANMLTVYSYASVRLEKGTNDVKVQNNVSSDIKDQPADLEGKIRLLKARYDAIKNEVPLRTQGQIENLFDQALTDFAKNDLKAAALKISNIETLVEYFENAKEVKDRNNLFIGAGIISIGSIGIVLWRRRRIVRWGQ